jgi:N-acetylneuraminic acid mutarotase
MEYARSGHQATLLLDGRVLVTGGAGKSGDAIARAEVFSPATGAWSLTGSTITLRVDHAAALLQDGRVLIVGGVSSSSSCSANATAETYDPVTGGWSPTAALPMIVGTGAAAVRLANGRVLVSGGGTRCGEVFNTAAVFNPSSNAWSAAMPMAAARHGHGAVLLTDGRVLVAGGTPTLETGSVSAELFDPATATWALAPGPFDVETLSRLGALTTGRTGATVTWLSNGKVRRSWIRSLAPGRQPTD